jgi:PAS domain S-box-containing protein
LDGSQIRPISVHAFPTSDRVFKERVREVGAEMHDSPASAVTEALERRLRPIHPNLTVQLRDDLAGPDYSSTIYVFRDGAVHDGLGPESWTEEATTARVVTDADGQYVEANDAAGRLFGVPTPEILGRRAGEFTRPDARIKDAAALWEVLRSTGRLNSLAVVMRPDKTEARVEFLTIRDGDGPGRNVTYLRAID